MQQKQMIAIVVVAVMVIAGAAAAISMAKGADTKKNVYNSNNLDGRLTVFGNANEDDYIDEKDVEEIKAIIAGEKEPVYHTCYKTYNGDTIQRAFADANCDGKIDNADLKIVQRMVDREKDMQVYFYDVDGMIGSCTYPLKTVAVGYKSNYEALLICNSADRITWTCDQVGDADKYGAYAPWYAPLLNDDIKCYGSRFTPDYEKFVEPGAEAPSMILSGTRAWFDPNMEERVAPLGIDVVRLPFYEDNWTTPAVITLGYLLGEEDAAMEYAMLADGVYDAIKDGIKDIPIEQRPLIHASYNGSSIPGYHGGVVEIVDHIGARSPYTLGYGKGNIEEDWLALTLNPDWILFSQYFGVLESCYDASGEKIVGNGDANSIDKKNTIKQIMTQLKDTNGKYVKFIDQTDAWNNGNVLFFQQGVFMGPLNYITAAYIANHVYGDRFDFDVDGLFVEYLNKYHPNLDAEKYLGISYFDKADYDRYLNAYF